MKILIGKSGFVGSNLKRQLKFDYEFNTQNIKDFIMCPNGCDLYLSCLSATKWKVNKDLEGDIKNIITLIDLLKTKKYNNVFLISTIDVYCDSPFGVDEEYQPNFSSLSYGSNRLFFEHFVKEALGFNNLYTFRLPALFGMGLKKNIIFDLLNNNQVDKINLNSYYQWYDLSDLYQDMCYFSNFGSGVYNLFTEPIKTDDLVNKFFPNTNGCKYHKLVKYDYKTKYSDNGYVRDREYCFQRIKEFINEVRN